MNAKDELRKAGEALVALRERKPLVLCLTNTVAANWTANCLLALGAVPAMLEEPEEAAELVPHAGALLVNVGTVTRAQAAVMRAAIKSARAAGVPWVLDPVAADKISYRAGLVRAFLREHPAVVRGNHGEIDWLLADCAKRRFGWSVETSVLSTGATDRIFIPGDSCVPGLVLSNGDPLLARVTATGCAQGAIVAAFCAVADPRTAALAAALASSLAGEAAARKTGRPGSFQAALLDAFDALMPDSFTRSGRLSEIKS